MMDFISTHWGVPSSQWCTHCTLSVVLNGELSRVGVVASGCCGRFLCSGLQEKIWRSNQLEFENGCGTEEWALEAGDLGFTRGLVVGDPRPLWPEAMVERGDCNVPKIGATWAFLVVEQADLTLCARCFVGGNYPKGINYSDFRRVEISEETKSGWNDKETLQLLEAITHYGDDWKKVAEHVGGRSEQECVTYFIKLPFGEQFVASQNPEVAHTNVEAVEDHMISSSPAKRRRLTPLADASNPIMAQAAFLSAMVGKEVARASAQAAVAALSEEYLTINQRKDEFVPDEIEQKESATATNGDYSLSILNLEEAAVDAQEHIKKEEQDMEKSISDIVEVEMKDLQDKIFHFEEVELQLENERQQLRHMKNLLFSDQLDLLIHRRTKPDGLKEKTMDVVS
ncbi:hypothetical protein GIB67_033698 [Kingdonia uniflora]|uniref:Uncharacterized protein n=1 Tax=Kingdonia uniflora TaxID=39325 RepID=A0A7J7P3Y7_9MAGN|nr:hypothetical protein GIB67_033698 [Kingdonia uniflora]